MTAARVVELLTTDIKKVLDANVYMQQHDDRELGHNQVLFALFPPLLPSPDRNSGDYPTPAEGKIWVRILKDSYNKLSKGSLQGLGKQIAALLDKDFDSEQEEFVQQYEEILKEGEARKDVLDPSYQPPLKPKTRGAGSKRGQEEKEEEGAVVKKQRRAGSAAAVVRAVDTAAEIEGTAAAGVGPGGSGWTPDEEQEELTLREMRLMVRKQERERLRQREAVDLELKKVSVKLEFLEEERRLLREVAESEQEKKKTWTQLRPFFPLEGKMTVEGVVKMWKKTVKEGGVPKYAERREPERTETLWSAAQLRSIYASKDPLKDILLDNVDKALVDSRSSD